MLSPSKTLGACCVLTLGILTAQTQNIVYADGDSNPTTGSRNAFPFGTPGIRYQAIYPHSLFGTKALNIATIRDILVAGTVTNVERVYDDIEIRMGITQQVRPTTNWTTNNPNPTTVYRGKLRVRCVGSPASLWGGIGLPKPYLYLPLSNQDNLCVEVIVWRAASGGYFTRSSTSLYRAFRNGWPGNQSQAPLTGTGACRMAFVLDNGNIALAGQGCQSSGNTPLVLSTNPSWPQPGKSLSINLTGSVKGLPAFLVVGTQYLWFDLAAAGAPGCFLWNEVLVPVPTATNASGGASFSATIPANVQPVTLLTHWVVFDRQANAAQLTTSDYATIIVGK
jgi:hypothetical protein